MQTEHAAKRRPLPPLSGPVGLHDAGRSAIAPLARSVLSLGSLPSVLSLSACSVGVRKHRAAESRGLAD